MTAAAGTACAAPVEPKTEEQIRTIERGLAFEWCCSVFEGNVLMLSSDELTGEVYDIGSVVEGQEDTVAECVQYLEWRGLLGRGTVNRNHVVVLDESEATR